MSGALVPLKYLAGINERSLPETTDADFEFDYVDISSVGRGLLTSKPARMRFEDAPSRARRLLRSGDTIVSTVRTYLRAVCPVEGDTDGLVASTGFAVLTPRSIDPRYFAWWVQSDVFIEDVVARSVGVSYPAINALELGELPVRVPSKAEQRSIADYLDAETARIDALIAKKQQLIHLLEERWQATLARAFSHPTGLRLKRLLAAPMAYGVLVPDHALDGPLMLRINDFRRGEPDPASVARISEGLHRQYRRTIVQEGDLVVSVVGTLGRAAIVPRKLAGANLNRPLARVQLRPEVPVDLVRMWCGSMLFAHQAELVTGSDSAQPTLNLGDLKNFTLGLPDSVAEWGELYRRLQRAEAWRDQARAAASRQIELISERRQALITAAVTGEFRVPRAAT